MTVATTTLGERGLLRLPASVRAEAGVDKGDEMIVNAVGPGCIVLTTRTAIQEEVWSAAPTNVKITKVPAERDTDNAAAMARRRRAKPPAAATSKQTSDDESERIGSALLTRFGA